MEHILLIEDNLPDVELIKSYLEDASFSYRLYTVKSLHDGLDIIKHHPINLALLDLALDDTTGLPTLNSFFDEVPDIPVIVLTGNANEMLGMNAIRAGAQDFLIKGEFNGKQLIRTIRHSMLRFKKQIDLRKEAWKMQQQEKYNKRLLAWAKLGSWEIDVLDNTMTWSEEMYRILGFQPDSFAPKLSDYLRLVNNEDKEQVEEQLNEAIKTGKFCEIEHRAVINNRTVKYLQLQGQVTSLESSGKIIFLGTIQDVSEMRRASQQPDSSTIADATKARFINGIVNTAQAPVFALAQSISQLDKDLSPNSIEPVKRHFSAFSDIFFQQINMCLFANKDLLLEETVISLSELKSIFEQIAFIKNLSPNFYWNEASEESIQAARPLFIAFAYNLLNTTLNYYGHNFKLHVEILKKETYYLHFTVESFENGAAHQHKSFGHQLQDLLRKKNFEPSQDHILLSVNALAKTLLLLKGTLHIDKQQHIELTLPLNPQNKSSYSNGALTNHAPRTLIIEHQSILQISLRRMLQSNFQKMEINYAENLHDGDLKICTENYDLALLDVQIPVKNGVSIEQLFRNTKSIPVIALSSDASDANRTALLQSGAIDCITNPPQCEELIEAVKKILEH
ncbi:MAG: response regulator [Saprospiraceae bacterium]|nr:response regulator [Saprospiraceae bacterium]